MRHPSKLRPLSSWSWLTGPARRRTCSIAHVGPSRIAGTVVGVLVVALAVGACSREAGDTEASGEAGNTEAADTEAADTEGADGAAPDPPSCDRLVVFEDEDWEHREAVDLPEDPGPLFDGEARIDWYAEFERFRAAGGGVTVGTNLRLSGHGVGIDEFRRALAPLELRPGSGSSAGCSPGRAVPARDRTSLPCRSATATR